MSFLVGVQEHPADAVACVENGQEFAWADLRRHAAAVRAQLTRSNVVPGDRVAIAASSEYAFIASLIGVLGHGAIAVPTNPMSPLPEMHRMLGPLEPRLIIASPMAAGMVEHGDDAPAPVVAFTDLPEAEGPDLPLVPRADDDVALLMMTSGTSGPAKAAMLTHGNLNWTLNNVARPNRQGVTSDDVVLCCLPPAHIFGLMIIAASALHGARAVMLSRFHPETSLELVAEHRVTLLVGAPLMWRRWVNAPGADDRLRSVTRALSGAAALPNDTWEAVKARYGVEIHEGYGLTETSATVASSMGFEHRVGSVGRAFDDVHILLVEADGTPADEGDTGEVVVRGPGVFAGYWNDPEATAQVLTEDGWLWTGDGGAFDADGNLFIVDRLKDVIIVSGFNVYPAEVEEVLAEHPGVAGAAVVGVTDDEYGERVAAWIVGTATVDEVRRHAAEHLASYKRPIEYHMVDELPITTSGKILRRELK